MGRAGEVAVSNRRTHYRVTAKFDKLVQIEMVGPKVHATNITLQDLSAGGAGLVLPKSASGMLRTRDRIELRLTSPKLTEGPVTLSARICHLDERLPQPRVGIAFESWREHRALLDSELRELFNEREAFRVEPGINRIITQVSTPDQRVRLTGHIRDISVLGFGLVLPLEAAERFETGRMVHLRFKLPNETTVIKVPAQIRFLRADEAGRQTLSGLRMADGLKVDPKHRRAIARYVMNRQRELLRMGLRPDGDPMHSARPELRA
ncbi:MAG: hypothetical protein CL927_02170 [Deltaproteobacteria bacterium]|nr:hypothetical protein [Deltaproteobacteria bacterium]HCH63596.1 hypothetical protein [Deltaproteobacteria bacterium]